MRKKSRLALRFLPARFAYRANWRKPASERTEDGLSTQIEGEQISPNIKCIIQIIYFSISGRSRRCKIPIYHLGRRVQLGKLSNLLRPQGKGKSLNDPTHMDREGEGGQGGGEREPEGNNNSTVVKKERVGRGREVLHSVVVVRRRCFRTG